MKIQKKKKQQNNIVLHKNQYNESTEKNLFNLMKLQSTMRGWQIYLKKLIRCDYIYTCKNANLLS